VKQHRIENKRILPEFPALNNNEITACIAEFIQQFIQQHVVAFFKVMQQ